MHPHPLLESIEIPGPDGSRINLCPHRSHGTLSRLDREYLRGQPVSLSFDPVQDGWLPAGAIDDLLAPPDTPSEDDLAARLVPACRTRIEAAAVAALARVARGDQTATEAAAELWKLPNSLIRRHGPLFDPSRQLEALEAMHNRAAQIIGERLIDDGTRDERNRRCADAAATYRLRPWTAADAPRFVELLDDERIWEHLPEAYPSPLTLDVARNLIEISNGSDHHLVRAIERDGEVIGQIRLSRQGAHVKPPLDAEISYWVGVDHWGQGVASSVIPLFTRQCFETSRLASIFARVAEANAASSRALEKSGYRFAGRYHAELQGEPEMRTYRCFRAEYLFPRPLH